MRYLFSSEGKKQLASLDPSKTLLAFDFDGTLAPIVDDPNKARTPAALGLLLDELGIHFVTAIISGRSVPDLGARIGFLPDYLVGNHGLEGLHRFSKKSARAATICRRWIKQLEGELEALANDPGIFLEKKRYSLSLHYRLARNKRKTVPRLRQIVAGLKPRARVLEGENIFNLIPPASPHKGHALLQILRESGKKSALFIGDDSTDEDVFCLYDRRIFSVCIGQRRTSCAGYFIKDRQEMQVILKTILKGMKQ